MICSQHTGNFKCFLYNIVNNNFTSAKIVEAEKLSFENKGDISFKEKEIINMEFVPEINRENDLSYNKNREKKEKDKFYLSNDVVYNNFVNLFVAKIKEKK